MPASTVGTFAILSETALRQTCVKNVPAIFSSSLILTTKSNYVDRMRHVIPKSLQILKNDFYEFRDKTSSGKGREIHKRNEFWRMPDPGKEIFQHFRLKDRSKNTTTTSVIVESDSPKMQNNRKTIGERMNASLL